MSMPLQHGDGAHIDQPASKDRRRNGLRFLIRFVSGERIELLVVLASLTVVFGSIGWWHEYLDNDPEKIKSVLEIPVRVIHSFFPTIAPYKNTKHWATHLGLLFGALTTVITALHIGLNALHHQITIILARHWLLNHTIVIGDTAIARRVARGFSKQGQRVLHVVPLDAQSAQQSAQETEVTRVRMVVDAGTILRSTGADFAHNIVIDVGSDTETLSIGKVMIKTFATSAPSRSSLRASKSDRRHDTLAFQVVDPVLADQFLDIANAEKSRVRQPNAREVPRLAIFDENRAIARNTLAREPLFVLANARGQKRVHAVVVGFGDLGEKILDQVMLTSIAGSLMPPRVTVIDRNAERRAREFRARRPNVLDTLDIKFLSLDIGLDPLEGADVPSSLVQLLELEKADGITAIFVTLGTDAETTRTALLLRRHCERTKTLDAPIFYRWHAAETAGDLLNRGTAGDPRRSDQFIRMEVPISSFLREITDPEGRDALARALHENYIKGKAISEQAEQAWEHLPETLRRANVRAADHLPAKLWTLGFDIGGIAPGVIPLLDAEARAWLFCSQKSPHYCDVKAKLAELTRVEHERWMIERKLDGWAYAPTRDNARHLHNLLVPWETLKKLPDEVEKDAEQLKESLQFVSERAKGRPIGFRSNYVTGKV